MKKHKPIDIPRWLSTLILTTSSFAIPLYIYVVNPAYLTSSGGYANGVETYVHTMEALHTKDVLGNMMSNLWFDGGALGYPMFIKTQPLPCFLIAVIMMLLQRLVSPLCVFRWIIVTLLTLLPLTWYKAARNFRFSRIQSISLALFLLCIDSQLQTGFELDAYLLHGYVPQLFAMLVMPIAASKIYLYGLQLNTRDQREAVFYTCLAYLSHINVGFYCSLLSLVTMTLFISANEFSRRHTKEAFLKIFKLHTFIFIYLSWWVVPLFISYLHAYNGGPSNNVPLFSLSGLVDLFTNGFLFGYRQKYQWTTFLVAIGLLVAMKNLKGLRHFNSLQFNQRHLFTTWLLMVSVLSIFLSIETSLGNFFRRTLHCQLNSDPRLYLFGVQFCGVVFASLTVPLLVDVLTYFTSRRAVKRGISMVVVGLLAVVMIRTSAGRVSERVTLVEVSEDFMKTLDSIKNNSKDGRMIAHDKFGTGGPWDLVNIPYLTGKSGVFLPGSKDSVSTFYLDSLLQSESCTIEQFHNLLNLYNVHFLVTSSSTTSVIDLSHFKLINKIYDMQFYQVTAHRHSYNYFEIVRLPGYINGRLKHIYQPVTETLELFSKQVLFYINPEDEETKERSIVDARVKDVSFVEKVSGSKELSLVHWHYEDEETNSEQAMTSLNKYYDDKWTTSLLLEEKHVDDTYHVIVHITTTKHTQFQLREHVLLKVSYHPFWRCHYFPVDEDYVLQEYNPSLKNEKRKQLAIKHVTPNLMAITLPPGRYHVIFRYRFPGILKLLAVLSSVILLDATFTKTRLTKNFVACVFSLYFVVLLFANKMLKFLWVLVFVVVTSLKRYRFRVIFPPVTKLLEKKCDLCFLPYIRNVKIVVQIEDVLKKSVFYLYNDCIGEIREKFLSRESDAKSVQKEGAREPSTEKRELSRRDVGTSGEKIDPLPSLPTNKHVKKSSRKKHMKRLSNENTIVANQHCNEIKHVESDECLRKIERSNLSSKQSKSDTQLLCKSSTKSKRCRSLHSSKSDSMSPGDDMIMGTEDCYISDSYMYNSDLCNDEYFSEVMNHHDGVQDLGNDSFDDILLSSDIFRTTWIAEKDEEDEGEKENEDEDEDLDLNKSMELSFSPLSSGSNTPSDYECNLSEFSSSPNEHSSPDDSMEYRKELENLEEITQSKKEVPFSSPLYRMSTVQPDCQTKRRCTVVEADDKIVLSKSQI